MKFKILLLFGLIYFSCTTKKSKESSPTAGEVNILVDSNLQNIMDQQKEVFERNYPYAKVNLIYLPAIDIVKKFLLDSNGIIILSRSLDSTEIKYLQSKTYVARHYELARSAVAFVTNKNNSDTAVTFESLRQLALIKGNSNGTFVIENASSGISQYLLKKFNEGINPNELVSGKYYRLSPQFLSKDGEQYSNSDIQVMGMGANGYVFRDTLANFEYEATFDTLKNFNIEELVSVSFDTKKDK